MMSCVFWRSAWE